MRESKREGKGEVKKGRRREREMVQTCVSCETHTAMEYRSSGV